MEPSWYNKNMQERSRRGHHGRKRKMCRREKESRHVNGPRECGPLGCSVGTRTAMIELLLVGKWIVTALRLGSCPGIVLHTAY